MSSSSLPLNIWKDSCFIDSLAGKYLLSWLDHPSKQSPILRFTIIQQLFVTIFIAVFLELGKVFLLLNKLNTM